MKKIVILAVATASLFATEAKVDTNTTSMLKAMAGTWAVECYEMPNKMYAKRQVQVKEDGNVVGDMVIYKDANCTKEAKKVHKEYSMKIGKPTKGDDGKEAIEIEKTFKNGKKIYTMIRLISPTEIMPADRTKDRNGTTVELRANHFGAKTVKCKKQ